MSKDSVNMDQLLKAAAQYQARQRLAVEIQARRHVLGYTQATLAESVGVPKKTLENWEQGIRCPSKANRKRLCAVLGLDEDALFD